MNNNNTIAIIIVASINNKQNWYFNNKVYNNKDLIKVKLAYITRIRGSKGISSDVSKLLA